MNVNSMDPVVASLQGLAVGLEATHVDQVAAEAERSNDHGASLVVIASEGS